MRFTIISFEINFNTKVSTTSKPLVKAFSKKYRKLTFNAYRSLNNRYNYQFK